MTTKYNWKFIRGVPVSKETPAQIKARKLHEEAMRKASNLEIARLLFSDGTVLRFHGPQEPLGKIEIIKNSQGTSDA